MNKLSNEDLEYLYGTKFSNGFSLIIDTKYKKIEGREAQLIKIIKDKSIIHFGCADHIDLIPKKIDQGNWLHANLAKAAKKTIGLDINKEAINLLQNRFQIKDIYAYDLFEDEIPDEIVNQEFDYLLLGEILEHVDNPVFFLSQIRQKFAKTVANLIITVPNFLSLINIKMALKDKEYINSDHRYWFSPFTLSKICSKANIVPLNYTFYVGEKYSLPARFLLKKFNLLKDGIILIGRLNND